MVVLMGVSVNARALLLRAQCRSMHSNSSVNMYFTVMFFCNIAWFDVRQDLLL